MHTTKTSSSTHYGTSNNSSDDVLNCDTPLWIQLLPEPKQERGHRDTCSKNSESNCSSIEHLSQSLKSWEFNERQSPNDADREEEMSCSSLTNIKLEDFIFQEEIMLSDLLEEEFSMGMPTSGNKFDANNSFGSIASIDSVALTRKRLCAEQNSAGATAA